MAAERNASTGKAGLLPDVPQLPEIKDVLPSEKAAAPSISAPPSQPQPQKAEKAMEPDPPSPEPRAAGKSEPPSTSSEPPQRPVQSNPGRCFVCNKKARTSSNPKLPAYATQLEISPVSHCASLRYLECPKQSQDSTRSHYRYKSIKRRILSSGLNNLGGADVV